MDKAKEVRLGEELDWKKLNTYLTDTIPECQGEMEVSQFHGGHANLTYLLKCGNDEFVMRRPPFGKIAPGAHDMKREYRVLSKLYKVFPQAPRAFHYCEDVEIIGAPFVIIERRKGVMVRYDVPDFFKGIDNIEERLATALVKVEAALHTVDVEAADLTKLGRPEGFLQRQLDGWVKRWELSKIEDDPAMTEIHQILSSEIPTPQAVSIVHNDIKFDNCQFQLDDPDNVTSIFDWDMTTLGDPLADFGVTLSYWPDKKAAQYSGLPVTLKGNFPDKQFMIEQYQKFSGYNLDKISWYESLAYWKGAVIAQQLYKRFVNGATKDKRMENFGKSAKALGEISLALAKSL